MEEGSSESLAFLRDVAKGRREGGGFFSAGKGFGAGGDATGLGNELAVTALEGTFVLAAGKRRSAVTPVLAAATLVFLGALVVLRAGRVFGTLAVFEAGADFGAGADLG